MRAKVAIAGLVLAIATSTAAADGPAIAIAITRYTLAQPGTWKHDFLIYALDDKQVPLANLVVVAHKAQDASGSRQIELHVGKPRSATGGDQLARNAPALVEISAQLDVPDTYTAVLYANAGGATAVVELAIEVKPAPAAIAVLPIAQVGVAQATAHVGDSVDLDIWLQNSSESVQNLSIGSATARSSRKAEGHVEKGSATARLGDLVSAVALAPKSAVRIPIAVTGLDEPGEYTGDIELDAGSHAARIPGTVTVYVSRGVVAALLCIGLGVLATTLVVLLRDKLIPRTQLRIALGDARRQLATIVPAETAISAVQRSLDAQIAKLEAEVAVTKADDLRRKLDHLVKRIALLDAAHTSAAAIAKLSTPATQQAKRRILDDVLAYAVSDDLNRDPAKGFELIASLGITDANRQELAAALEALERSADEHRRSSDPAVALAIERNVDPVLAAARKARDADDLVSFAHELATARTALAEAGRQSIRAALERKPSWMSDAGWREVGNEVRPKLGGDYETLRTAFVASVRTQAIAAAERLKNPAFDAAIASAREAGTDRATQAATTRALQDLLAVGSQSDVVPTGFDEAHPMPSTIAIYAFAIPALPKIDRGVLSPAVRTSAEGSAWSSIRARLRTGEVALTLVALALALAGGIELLWMDNATWGSASDELKAVLWGSGVRLTADAFSGVSWLRAALGKVA